MDHPELDELKNTLKRLEGVVNKLRSWTGERTWDESRKLIDQIPLKIHSLEYRADQTKRLFISEKTIVEKKRTLTFAELVRSSEAAVPIFVDFLTRICNREVKSKREELRVKLIADASYDGKDIYSKEVKSEINRQTGAIPKTTHVEMLRRFFSDEQSRGSLISDMDFDLKLKSELGNATRYGSWIYGQDLEEAVTEIVRKLIRSHNLPLTFAELGIEEHSSAQSPTEHVTITKPVLNTVVSDEIVLRLEAEIREIGAKIEHLQSNLEVGNSTITLPFEIFPTGEWDAANLIRRFRQSGVFLRENHIQRLETIMDVFKPERVAVGKLDSRAYKGYFVFIFDRHDKVIAENPLYGNATYVIKGNWEEILEILRLSKSEVRRHRNSQFVIHRDKYQWLHDLKQKFGYWH